MARSPQSWAARLESGDGEAIVAALSEPRDNADDDLLLKYFETVSQQKSSKLWACIAPYVNSTVSKLNSSSMPAEEMNELVTGVAGCVHAMKLFFSACKQSAAQIQPLVLSVSDLLSDFDDESESSSALKNALSALCEQYIVSHGAGSEQLLPQTLTYLLRESLRVDAKEAVLKRLVSIKHGFQLLDFSNTNNSFCRELLLRCFVHPSYIKCADARKLLADLIAASDGVLCDAACQVIKVQVSTGSTLLASQYGTILFRAWKDHAGKSALFRKKIEDAVQDFIHEAVHADGAKRLKGLRALVKSFHDVSRTDAFNQLLVDAFDPIIWRSLRCANAIVRSQAAVLFLDVFPLQRTSSNPEECDQLLQKQFDQLIGLLKDGDHRVRSIATTGVCHILREYWDMLPAGTVHNLLKYVFDTLAFDASSANVRFAVVMGVQDLLEQPLSHKALCGLLPLLKNYIHDKSEKVRVAFVRLLDTVKTVQDMVFYEIVPVPHLLARLAEDRGLPDMVAAMTNLLLNSYFPQSTGNKFEKVNRCLQFLQDNALAAEAFYSHVHKVASVGAVAKLTAMLFSLLLVKPQAAAVEAAPVEPQAKQAAGKRRRGGAQKPAVIAAHDDSADLDAPPLIKEPVTFLRVLRLTAAMLGSLKKALPNHPSSMELIAKYITVADLSQMITVAISQEENTEFLVAGALQLVATMGELLGAKAAGQAFTLQFFVQSVYVPVLPAARSELGRRMLANGLVQATRALDMQVELLGEVCGALKEACGATKKKKTSGSLLTLEQAADVVSSFVDFTCRSISEEVGEKASAKLVEVWVNLKTLLAAVGGKGSKTDSSAQLPDADLEALVRLGRAWATFSVFATSSAAISSLLPGEAGRVDSTLDEMNQWLDRAIASPLEAVRLPANSCAAKLASHLTCSRLALLADALDLLPSATSTSVVRVVASDISLVAKALDVAADKGTTSFAVPTYYMRKTMVVCDRVCHQWAKLKGQLDAEGFGLLSQAASSFLAASAGMVNGEDGDLDLMYRRCTKATGVALGPTEAREARDQDESCSSNEATADESYEGTELDQAEKVVTEKPAVKSKRRGRNENVLANL